MTLAAALAAARNASSDQHAPKDNDIRKFEEVGTHPAANHKGKYR